jgi:hypothetical protein
MIEYILYEYVRDAYRQTNSSFSRPLTEDLIIHLVGGFGLDILKKAKLIEPTSFTGQYVLCCEI